MIVPQNADRQGRPASLQAKDTLVTTRCHHAGDRSSGLNNGIT